MDTENSYDQRVLAYSVSFPDISRPISQSEEREIDRLIELYCQATDDNSHAKAPPKFSTTGGGCFDKIIIPTITRTPSPDGLTPTITKTTTIKLTPSILAPEPQQKHIQTAFLVPTNNDCQLDVSTITWRGFMSNYCRFCHRHFGRSSPRNYPEFIPGIWRIKAANRKAAMKIFTSAKKVFEFTSWGTPHKEPNRKVWMVEINIHMCMLEHGLCKIQGHEEFEQIMCNQQDACLHGISNDVNFTGRKW